MDRHTKFVWRGEFVPTRPLQALVTLNDSVYVEAAGYLAKRMTDSAHEPRQQIKNGFILAIGHEPSEPELNVLVDLSEKVPMTMVANAIMNLDEFITKN
ncbi:MAG: DUF1553 domain-containing protein [Bacteroidota bacterium]